MFLRYMCYTDGTPSTERHSCMTLREVGVPTSVTESLLQESRIWKCTLARQQ